MPAQLKSHQFKVNVISVIAGLAAAADLHLLGFEHPTWLRTHTHSVCACFHWHLVDAYVACAGSSGTCTSCSSSGDDITQRKLQYYE
jgi:hypothetical protein